MRRTVIFGTLLLTVLMVAFVEESFASCTPTPSPTALPTYTPDANGTIIPLPTATPYLSPTPTPMGTHVSRSEWVVSGVVDRREYSSNATEYAIHINQIYKGDPDPILEFTYWRNPCDNWARYGFSDGENVLLFTGNGETRQLTNYHVFIHNDDLHGQIVQVTGHEPKRIVPLAFPFALVLLILNFSLWGVVISRKLLRGV